MEDTNAIFTEFLRRTSHALICSLRPAEVGASTFPKWQKGSDCVQKRFHLEIFKNTFINEALKLLFKYSQICVFNVTCAKTTCRVSTVFLLRTG